MVFVPFSGLDHHKNHVFFGGGLLSSETIEAYSWVIKSFLKAHVKQPRLVISHDDDDLKEAIALILPQSAHRLCMLHTMYNSPLEVRTFTSYFSTFCDDNHEFSFYAFNTSYIV